MVVGITVQVVTRTLHIWDSPQTSVVAVYDSPHAAELFVNSEHAPIEDKHGTPISYVTTPMTVLDMNQTPVAEDDYQYEHDEMEQNWSPSERFAG